MSIKGHPPWYARGTPVTNIRDGPAMAINHKLLFAICRGPSARGEMGEWGDEVGRQRSEDGRRKHENCRGEVGRQESEDQSRYEPMGKNRRWLTLNTTFFNTQNSVFSQWYALLGRNFDLSGRGDGRLVSVRSFPICRNKL